MTPKKKDPTCTCPGEESPLYEGIDPDCPVHGEKCTCYAQPKVPDGTRPYSHDGACPIHGTTKLFAKSNLPTDQVYKHESKCPECGGWFPQRGKKIEPHDCHRFTQVDLDRHTLAVLRELREKLEREPQSFLNDEGFRRALELIDSYIAELE